MADKLVVVDDDPVSRRWVIDTLGKAGYEVVEGTDGQQALSLARDERPDLLLLDVEMPGMGGPEVCRIIKGNKSFGFLPIILMTARDDVQTKVEGLELGADDYLIKPLNPLELLARVKSMLRLKRLQDEVIRTNERLTAINERLQALSTTDGLLGISNRMSFDKRIAYEFQRSDRYGKPLALLILDLDHFKRVNDTHGHPFGDKVLKAIADLLVDSVRQVDFVARYGGEEMVVALPETNRDQALIVAERIRSRVEALEVVDGDIRSGVTVSIGLSVCPHEIVGNVKALLKEADDALYRAKQDGRNCIRVANYLGDD